MAELEAHWCQQLALDGLLATSQRKTEVHPAKLLAPLKLHRELLVFTVTRCTPQNLVHYQDCKELGGYCYE